MLETIWFLLWGILWAVYFMLGGFDLGVGMLSPVIAKTDAEKQKILGGVIGPFWDGNEVWLITAGRRDVRRLSGRPTQRSSAPFIRLSCSCFSP